MKVVAISGWKGSGKDTVADYLVDTKEYIKFSFAENLKRSVVEQYDLTYLDLTSRDRKEKALSNYPVEPKDGFTDSITGLLQDSFRQDDNGILCWTPRALAILEGSVKRSVNPNYWVDSVISRIDRVSQHNDSFVISDLRYKSEIERLKEVYKEQLVTVRINRFTSVDTNDPSERDLDNYSNFDVVLDVYDFSIDEVKKLVDTVSKF